MSRTHAVANQPPPLADYDLYASTPLLRRLVEAYGVRSHDAFEKHGRLVGSSEVFEWGFQANRNPPVLRTHDRFGHRIDQVDFHPAWHSLLDLAVSHGLHSLPWEGGRQAFLERAVLTYLSSQVEAGHWCPISMTSSVIPVLRHQPEIAGEWEPRILSRVYDPTFQPADRKAGVLLGMGMTEKQGGSDVRANTTTAARSYGGGPGGEYRLTGHKWFTSAPMCDGFVVLAQAPGGLSCFLMPRWTPGGEPNTVHIQRLKDKLGNRSNASTELELHGAWARLVGDEGRGVPVIIEMVNGTRLDCVTGSAALMRQAVSQAAHHVAHRRAFGTRLLDAPLMQNVVADLEVETEAAEGLMVRTAVAFDGAAADQHEAALRRILTPVAKYWVTKRCSETVHEALECLGGNGYVEESIMPRLFRESPLNAIWEGSGNVIALDVLRAIHREPETLDAFMSELDEARGADPRLDRHIDAVAVAIDAVSGSQREARRIVGRMAAVMAASILARHAAPAVADAFVSSRLEGDWGHLLGTLPAGVDTAGIARTAVPV